MEQQKKIHQWAADDFNHKHTHYLSLGSFVLGMWALLHETWLDAQMGNKGALRWTSLYIIHHQLHDMTYQLWELDGTVMRGSAAAKHLKVFYYWEEHQMVCSVQHAEFAWNATMVSLSSAHTSMVIGMLNQDLLVTLPYPVSVKIGESALPENCPLVYLLTVILSACSLHNLHGQYHPTISKLKPNELNPVWYIHYTGSLSIFPGHIHETLLENSNIHNLETGACCSSLSLSAFIDFFNFILKWWGNHLNFSPYLWKCRVVYSHHFCFSSIFCSSLFHYDFLYFVCSRFKFIFWCVLDAPSRMLQQLPFLHSSGWLMILSHMAFYSFLLFFIKFCVVLYLRQFPSRPNSDWDLDARVKALMITMPTLKGAEVHINRPLMMSISLWAMPSSMVWWRELTGCIKTYF